MYSELMFGWRSTDNGGVVSKIGEFVLRIGAPERGRHHWNVSRGNDCLADGSMATFEAAKHMAEHALREFARSEGIAA